MQGSLQTSPVLGYSIDSDDTKYFSGLSTILVATIQEMKDRISQIEYIFCSQLFPKFQSRSKDWQKRFAETMKAAEDDWKKKESGFLIQIEELQHAKNQALEELRHLVASLEKEKKANDESRKAAQDDWRRKESSLLLQMDELRLAKNQALEEIRHLVASLEKEKYAKDESRKAVEDQWRMKESSLLLQMEELQLEKKKALGENRCLISSLEQVQAKLMNNEQLLAEQVKEKKQLLARLESLEKNGEVTQLQGQLQQKIEEVEEGKRLQQKLLRQMELKDSEMIIEKKKRKDTFDSYKRVKSQYTFLLNKLSLNMDGGNKMEEERSLLSPQKDQRLSPGPKSENPQTSGQASSIVSKMTVQKDDISLQERQGNVKIPPLVQNSSSPSKIKPPVISSYSHPKEGPASIKSNSLAGAKRPVSYWRDTRLRQKPGGADPHDDFLDTPMENIRGNLNKVLKQEVHDLAAAAPNDMGLDSFDDETQDLNQGPASEKQQVSITRSDDRGFKCAEPPSLEKQQITITRPGDRGFKNPGAENPSISITRPDDRGFKYVEPVRKKADRENLKGFECKQCKKFYDAVLPDGSSKNGENTIIRCEHQDGVSRHRYRYQPPSTPEGFWNIGFDSEMCRFECEGMKPKVGDVEGGLWKKGKGDGHEGTEVEDLLLVGLGVDVVEVFGDEKNWWWKKQWRNRLVCEGWVRETE